MRSTMLIELDIHEQDKVSSCWHCAVLIATPGRHMRNRGIEISIRNVCDP
jgi:hypothetical protein